MSNPTRVKGNIAHVWDNASQATGRPYKVIELDDGSRYSLWDAGQFNDMPREGEIDFEYKLNGKGYKNIQTIYTSGAETSQEEPDNGNEPNNGYKGHKPGNGKNANPVTANPGGNGRGVPINNDYQEKRDSQMVRMSSLKTAATLYTGTKIPYDQRGEKTVETAKHFERYITGDLGYEEPEPPMEMDSDID